MLLDMSDSVQEETGSLNHGIKVGAVPAHTECNGTLAAVYGSGIVSQCTDTRRWSGGRLVSPVLVLFLFVVE